MFWKSPSWSVRITSSCYQWNFFLTSSIFHISMSYTAVKLIAPDSLNSFATESSWRNRNVPNKKKECKTITRKSKFERNVSNASTSRERRKCSRFIKKWRVKWQSSLNYLFRRIRMREHTIMKARKSGRIDTPTSFSVHHIGYLSDICRLVYEIWSGY